LTLISISWSFACNDFRGSSLHYDGIAASTANVFAVEFVENGSNSQTRITLDGATCSGQFVDLDNYVVSVTSSQFSGVREVLAEVICLTAKPTLRVRLYNDDLFGPPVTNNGFDFIVYRF